MIPLALLAALAGCRKAPTQPVAAPEAAGEVEQEVVPTGWIEAGRYQDRGGRFSIAVPGGWSGRPGLEPGALRVSLDHPPTGARVEVWRFVGEDLSPRPRDGCLWTFTDRGPYRALRVTEPVTVATCMPDDPDAPRILAWIVARTGETWQLEVHVPGEGLVRALEAGRAALATARWAGG